MAESPNGDWLKLIQGVIDRLARESANLKAWSITLLGAGAILSRVSNNHGEIIFALPAFVLLGFLDAYYLGAERAYRRHYRRAIDQEGAGGDSSGSTTSTLYEWSMAAGDGSKPWRQFGRWIRQGFGPTVVLFHGAIIIVVVVISVLDIKHSS